MVRSTAGCGHQGKAARLDERRVIAVGSELLTPERVDTNSLFLTGRLNALGIEVVYKCVWATTAAPTEAVRLAAGRSEVVILSAASAYRGRRDPRCGGGGARRGLTFHQEIADRIEARFRRGRPQDGRDQSPQAYVIDGAEVLP